MKSFYYIDFRTVCALKDLTLFCNCADNGFQRTACLLIRARLKIGTVATIGRLPKHHPDDGTN